MQAVELLPAEDRGVIELGYYEGLAKERWPRIKVDGAPFGALVERATRRLVKPLGDDSDMRTRRPSDDGLTRARVADLHQNRHSVMD